LRLASADGRSVRVRSLPAAVGIEAGIPLRPYRLDGYLAGLGQAVECVRWPKKVPARTVVLRATAAGPSQQEEQPQPLLPAAAAQRLLVNLGHGGTSFAPSAFDGPIEDVDRPGLAQAASSIRAVGVISADADGRLQPSAA